MRNPLQKYSPVRLIAISSFLAIFVVSGLTLFVYSIVNQTIKEQIEFATKIDVGGYQRMLSQRIAYYTTEYTIRRDVNDKTTALESIKLLYERHQLLINEYQQLNDNNAESLLSNTLQNLYFAEPTDLNSALIEYARLAQGLLEQPDTADPQALALLKEKSQQILEKFDRIVQQYEREGNERILQLTILQTLSLIVSALLVFILIVFIIRPLTLVSEALSERLQNEASRDYLTGLHNRRVFPALAEQAIAMSRRRSLPVTIVLFDIDNFKVVNDQYGHTAGDKVVQAVAESILANSRESDEAFRFGGDEFVMILPFTDVNGAFQVADNIRAHIEKLDSPTNFSVSGGVAKVLENENYIEPALLRADKSLYQAKGNKKNRIEIVN